MKPSISAMRAITAEFARQFVRPFLWIGLGMIAVIVCLMAILAFTLSPWWWLLTVPIAALGLVGLVIWILVRFILGQVSPHLNQQQKTATKQLVTKLQSATETIQTPYPVIVFYVIRDIILRRDSGFISQVTQQSKTLRPDFEALKKLF
jgi:uncharacterized membrane protein